MVSVSGGKRALARRLTLMAGSEMAARGHLLLLLLLLICTVSNPTLALARQSECGAAHKEDNQRQAAPISMVEQRSEHTPRLHGVYSKKVLPVHKAEQQNYSPMPSIRRRRQYNMFRNEEVTRYGESPGVRREYYLTVPPSRIYPHLYQDPVHQSKVKVIRGGHKDVIIPEPELGVASQIYQGSKEDLVWDLDGENRRQFMNRMPHYESFEEMFSDLKNEKIKQANSHHNAGHALNHEGEHKHNHENEHKPGVNHDEYWMTRQRRFRIIVLIVLAVLVFSIVLILAWFFLPRKLTRKIRNKK